MPTSGGGGGSWGRIATGVCRMARSSDDRCLLGLVVSAILVALAACSEPEEPAVGVHVAALVNGSGCTSPSQCDSGICEDGICCAVSCGSCRSCEATGTTCSVNAPAGDSCGPSSGTIQDGFESGTSNWTLQSPWGTTTTLVHTGSYSLTDSPAGQYTDNLSISATLATPFSLVGASSPTLTFWHHYNTENSWDYGRVEISTNGTTWSQLTSYTGSNTGFTNVTISLASYVGQPSVRIRFRFTTDGSIHSYDGWTIDDVTINVTIPGQICHVCDGSGGCTVNAAPGTDCGTCGACDVSGNCVADLSQNADCPVCRQCSAVGTCSAQPSGSDLKDECISGPCATGACNGSGACSVSPTGSSCGTCASCNSGGSCVADLSHDVDCPACQECTGIGTCANEAAGVDVKNDCPSGGCVTGACNGMGACGLQPNGTDCDPDLCSDGATCMNGTCGPPATVVTCTPPDPCWEPGECNPSTGACGASPGPRPDGVSCDDGLACTAGDRCLDGVCTPVGSSCACTTDDDCVTLDACHLAGTCTAARVCVYPDAPEGTP